MIGFISREGVNEADIFFLWFQSELITVVVFLFKSSQRPHLPSIETVTILLLKLGMTTGRLKIFFF